MLKQKNKLDINVERSSLKDEDLPYLDDKKLAILNESSFWANALLYAIGAFIIVAIIWAKYAIIDETTNAMGKVIPSSQVQVIQNLEGGILSEILVSEGDVVEKGQVLLRIDDTRFASSYREARSRYLALLATTSRLRAESLGKDKVEYPKVVEQEAPEVVKSEDKLFEFNQDQLASNLKTLEKSYELAVKELDITKPLVDEGLMSQLELLRLQREVNDLEGKIESEKDRFRTDARTKFNEKDAELSALSESILAMEDRMVRTTIKSPVKGTVKKINISTIGGVIKPGMDIMEIVPFEDTLLIEAKVKPSDIAFIHPGQEAIVKVSAYDFSIYGSLPGTVEYISADTIEEDENRREEEFYKILVRTQKNALGTEEKPLPIIPGMVVTVDILTGKKSVLDYILKPFLKAKERALRER